MPTLPWFPRTEKLAEQVADLIVGNRFLVKYDKTTAPVIDAAVRRNPILDQEQAEAILYTLWDDEHIVLYDLENHPPMLACLQGSEADYAEFLTYDDCVDCAEGELNQLLRFASFDYRRYMLHALPRGRLRHRKSRTPRLDLRDLHRVLPQGRGMQDG